MDHSRTDTLHKGSIGSGMQLMQSPFGVPTKCKPPLVAQLMRYLLGRIMKRLASQFSRFHRSWVTINVDPWE